MQARRANGVDFAPKNVTKAQHFLENAGVPNPFDKMAAAMAKRAEVREKLLLQGRSGDGPFHDTDVTLESAPANDDGEADDESADSDESGVSNERTDGESSDGSDDVAPPPSKHDKQKKKKRRISPSGSKKRVDPHSSNNDVLKDFDMADFE